jgi:hypothetical protein
METRRIVTRFGPADVRVYRLHEGWWPVLVGRHGVPREPSMEGPLARSVDGAVARMVQAVDRLPEPAAQPVLVAAGR